MEKSEKQGLEIQSSAWAKKEEEILSFWQDNNIFEKTLEQNSGIKHFVFYDGPPFATGLPHYGHLLASIIKDAIPRYRTMKGDFVRRVWGWDCHGLPIENLIEKELGLEHKKDIEELGIDKFNTAAKASVLRYDEEWKKMIPRIGRWIDMEHGYKTMDAKYTESIWWAFKELYDKGLVYKGYKSMHICPRCETTLSNNEVAQGYQDITDISVTAKFELVDEPGTYVLAWTTTPWTLPGNVALAINPEEVYQKITVVKSKDSRFMEGESYIMGATFRRLIIGNFVPFEGKDYGETGIKDLIIKTPVSVNLKNKSYKPVFDYYSKNKQLENRENGWKIYAGDFVTTESGTGIVHIAPAFGEDDMNLGKKHNLPFVQHVSFDGKFKEEVKDFAGMFVKPKVDHQKTDIEIIKYLAHKGLLFSKLKITHSYPHCWRCDTPLLNYATSSWFIKVAEMRDKLVKLNKKVNWIPESVGEGRFGNWLENARDWSISRTRFWGAPLPVWECNKCEEREVIGSVEDIKKKKEKRNNYFVMRHGEAESNANNVVSSKIGNRHHLTEKGEKQVVEVAKELKKKNIDIIISSPFLRTKETAQIVSREIGIKESDIIFDERIKEVDTGIFDGGPVSDYRNFFESEIDKIAKRPKGGENLVDVRKRVMFALEQIDKKYIGKNILIVSHEYPIWSLVAGTSGMNKDETVRIKEASGDDFINNAEIKEIDFVLFPHNGDWELDLHRPYIDEVVFNCNCGGVMKRIPDVFDCWIESGSMPFAQFHYPFENRDEFRNNFPADFIAEGIDQTRGWFYTLLVLSEGLFGEAPYKNVVVNGMILAEDGRKMSKRLKNYPQPMEIVNKYSADALRYYMLSSPVVHAEELCFSEKGVDEVQKKVIGRLLNVLSFYKLYENENISASNKSENVLDKWIVARLNETIKEIETSLDKYELDRAVRPIGVFVDDLSTWYLRRSRGRIKGENIKDKETALATMRFVLSEFSKTVAPFMPFLAENVYREVAGEKESVHLEGWVKTGSLNKKILEEMGEVRKIVSLGLEARANVGIKVRQPIASLKIKNQKSKIKNNKDLLKLIEDEVNIKEIMFDEKIQEEVELDTKITPELKKEGQFREFVRHIQGMRKSEKFTPSDMAIIHIETTDNGKDFIAEFMEELKSATPLKSVEFKGVSEGVEVNIDNLSFKISISK
jgi:isoleucyl-tRNA synthetase